MPTAKSNPTFIKGRLKTVPKGKRKGEMFMHGGKRYIVISYVTSTGKRVRYAQAVSKTNVPGKRTTKKAKRSKRTNPWTGGAFPTSREPGTRIKRRGKTYLVRNQRGTNINYAQQADLMPKIPKGKSVGQTFRRGGQTFKIYQRQTPKGGYKRYVKAV